jgi:hypothetical protein
VRLLLLLVISIVLIAATPAPARAGDCAPTTVRGVRIIELTDELGCDRGADLASRAVRHHGFLKDGAFFCRWGQGGTAPIKRHGHTFFQGFCSNVDTDATATFLARAPLKDCDRSENDVLRTRYIACRSARRVYSHAVSIAIAHPHRSVLHFHFLGDRWTCRTTDPRIDPGRVSSCRAPNDVLVEHIFFIES